MFVIPRSPHRAASRQNKYRARGMLSLVCAAAMLVPSVSYGTETGLGSERLIDEDQTYLSEAVGKGRNGLEDAIAQVFSDFVSSLVGYVSDVKPEAAEDAAVAAGQVVPHLQGIAQNSRDRLTRSDRTMIREASRRGSSNLEVAVQRVIFNQAVAVAGFVADIRPDLSDDIAYASIRAVPGSFRNIVRLLGGGSSDAVRFAAAQGVASSVSFAGVSEQRRIIFADLIDDVGTTNVAAVNRTVQPTAQNGSAVEELSAVERLRAARTSETPSLASITPTRNDSTRSFEIANALFAQAGINQNAPTNTGCDLSGVALSAPDRVRLTNAARQGDNTLRREINSAIQDRALPAGRVVSFLVDEFPGSINLILRTGIRAKPDEASSMVCAAAASSRNVSPAALVVIATNAGAENLPALIVAASQGSGTSVRSVLATVARVADLERNELVRVVSRLVDMGHGSSGSSSNDSGSGSGDGATPGRLKNPLMTPGVVAGVVKPASAVTVGVDMSIPFTSTTSASPN